MSAHSREPTASAINIGTRASIRNLHDLGASWPQAIRSAIDIRGRVAYALIDSSRVLYDAGERILMKQLKDAQREARRLELERDGAALENLGRAFDEADILEASSWADTTQ